MEAVLINFKESRTPTFSKQLRIEFFFTTIIEVLIRKQKYYFQKVNTINVLVQGVYVFRKKELTA